LSYTSHSLCHSQPPHCVGDHNTSISKNGICLFFVCCLMCDLCLFDVRFQTNKVIKQSRNNDGLLVTRVVVADDKTGGQLFDRPGPPGKRRAGKLWEFWWLLLHFVVWRCLTRLRRNKQLF